MKIDSPKLRALEERLQQATARSRAFADRADRDLEKIKKTVNGEFKPSEETSEDEDGSSAADETS